MEITCRFGPAPGETFAPDLVVDAESVPVLVHGGVASGEARPLGAVGSVRTVTQVPGHREVVLTLDPACFTLAPTFVQTSHGWRLVDVSLVPK